MKIQKANAAPLTNFEVLDLLRSRGAAKDTTRAMSLITPSEFKVYDYLVESAAYNQTRESINTFLEKSKDYQLTKAELINIINIRPTSAVEIASIIEHHEERNLEEQLDNIVEMVMEVLPPPLNEQNSDEEAAEDGVAEMPAEDGAAELPTENGDAEMPIEDGDAEISNGDNAEKEVDTS
ncbi:unnamed protein product [Amaranthus hypochondriacus]